MTEHIVVPDVPVKTGKYDILERALWTLAQTVTAGGLLIGWNAIPDPVPDIPDVWVLWLTPPLAFGLSALKGYLATKYSANGTASTLRENLAPVLTEKVIVQETGVGLAVAGNAVLVDEKGEDVPAGTPVDLDGLTVHENPPTSGDVVAVPDDIEPPAGFDDGSDPALRQDPPEGTYAPEHAR